MSYILDALRRADAERERGSVPGIHAQPAMLGEADGEADRPARRGGWLGGGLGLVLLALLGWWFVGHDAPRPVAVPVAAAPIPVSAPPMTAPPVMSAPAPAAVPAVAAAPAAVPTPAADMPRKPPSKVAVAAAAKPTASKPAARAATSPPSAPAATEVRVYALSELPDDIRRELPTLAVGGAMYSQNPANRLLIVNGQTFHEGDRLAPSLSLEQIRLKSAVLEYKGYRYGITY